MIAKEVRALLPAWALCVVAIVASHNQGPGPVHLGFPLYLIGAAGLGAWSFGHEYAYGTLGAMLALPVARRRWWTAKLVVLAPALAGLALLAASFVVIDRDDRSFGGAIFWAPAVAALCIAPWLTIAARSAVAGAVFTVGLLGGALSLGEWIGISRFGYTRDVDVFRRMFFVWSLTGLSIVGIIAGWRTFAGLQDAGEHQADWQLLSRSTAASAAAGLRRRPALVALILKELRLHQLAYALSGVYVIANLAVLFLRRADVFGIFEVLMAVYIVTLPALIGSLACAEERQVGMLDSQLLLPVRTSVQWFIKVATAIGLSIALALLVPAMLARLLPAAVHIGPRGQLIAVQTVMMVFASVTISLYVSSIARGGMAALLWSIAAIPGLAYFDTYFGGWVSRTVFTLVHHARAPHVHGSLVIPSPSYYSLEGFAVFILALAGLAFFHYRRADRRPSLVAFHAALVAAGIAAYNVAMGVMMALRY